MTSFVSSGSGNRRELCKARLRPVAKLKRQALLAGDQRAFAHYADVEWREMCAYRQGLGRYGAAASLTRVSETSEVQP